jgi:hypothetical protein
MAIANAQQLLNAARGEAAATTAGPLSQLASEIAAQNAQNANATKDISGYFKGLGNYVNTQTGAVNQVGSNLASQMAGLSSQEQGQLQGISNNSANLMNQYVPKGDADVGSAGMQSLVGNLAAQQGYATQDMAAQQAAGTQQQANYQDLAHALAGADATGGRQDLANVQLAGAAKIQPLAEKYGSEVDKEGALTESDYSKLQQQEATNQYHDALVQLAGGKTAVAQENANTGAAKAKSQAAYQQGQLQLGQEKVSATQSANQARAAYQQGLLGVDKTKANASQQAAQSLAAYRTAEINLKQGSGGATPLTSNENNKILNDLGQAVSASRQLSKTQNTQTILSDLTSGNAQLSLQGGKYRTLTALPRPVVQAALEVMQGGTITHQTYTQLHQMGVRGLPFKVAAPVK